jgi:hypothetical protein
MTERVVLGQKGLIRVVAIRGRLVDGLVLQTAVKKRAYTLVN